MARLQAIDGTFITISIGYLLLIAFLPFPTGLLGEYFENPLAVAIFATTAAAVSAVETVFVRAAPSCRPGPATPPERRLPLRARGVARA
jgi:uncharacterized membrane protein